MTKKKYLPLFGDYSNLFEPDGNNPFKGDLCPTGIYISPLIHRNPYLNWPEKILVSIIETSPGKSSKFYAEIMGYTTETIRNMKYQIGKKLREHEEK